MRKVMLTRRTHKRTVDETDYTSIVIEKDYTQVYDCFSKLAVNIHSGTSYKLLFWLLAYKAGTEGNVQVDAVVYQQFNDFLISECGKDCSVTRRTFDNCLAELKNAHALTMITKGHYQANTYGFWRGATKQRVVKLDQQLAPGALMEFNPDHDTVINTSGS